MTNSATSATTPQHPKSSKKDINPTAGCGTLYGLGIGPGDPELITVKALKQLQAAPVIAFPAGLNGRPGVAERTVEPWLSAEQTKLPLHFPYVQDEKELAIAWEKAAQTVWPYLQTGDVAFACEGDISFYSTFTYLAQNLKAQQPSAIVKTIAGISSPMAAAAALGIPLTCGNQNLAVLPALYNVHQLESALEWADVIVLMKVGSVYGRVWKILEQHQLLSHSYVVEHATRDNQVTYTDLKKRPSLKLPYFSIMIVKQAKIGIAGG